MVSIDASYIEVQSEDIERLAQFYERLLGLARVEATGTGVLLQGQGLLLRIKPADGEERGDSDVVFGFRLAAQVDLATCRDEAVASGAIVLSESKRGAIQTLACQDPAGNEFLLVSQRATSTEATVPNLALAARRTETIDRGSGEGIATRADDAPPQRATRVSRLEIDQLLDKERLAVMQESIAGLDMPFSPDDPATVLSDMRSKLGAPSSLEKEVAAADAALRARIRQAEADVLLERYRNETHGEIPAPPSTSSTASTAEVEANEPAPRTLGRSAVTDDAEAEDPRKS